MRAQDIFRHKAGAYRSGLEEATQQWLADHGINAAYEPLRLSYRPQPKHYTPDFILPNGIIIETKGYFTPADRTKHLLIQRQYPALDLRFVFARPYQRLNKTSKTTYAEWCDKHDFKWSIKQIPEAWLKEPPNEQNIAILKEVHIIKWHAKSTLS